MVWATHDPVHADDYARYRTRVATAAELAPGTLVFVAAAPAGAESQADIYRVGLWTRSTVVAVDAAAGTVAAADGNTYPLARTRIAVETIPAAN